MLAAVIESLHQAPTAVCSAAESAMAYALLALMDPELPVNMSVVVAVSGMSQQRVWLNAEAPLNILSKVVTLETAGKRTYVCACMDRNVEKAGIRGQGNVCEAH